MYDYFHVLHLWHVTLVKRTFYYNINGNSECIWQTCCFLHTDVWSISWFYLLPAFVFIPFLFPEFQWIQWLRYPHSPIPACPVPCCPFHPIPSYPTLSRSWTHQGTFQPPFPSFTLYITVISAAAWPFAFCFLFGSVLLGLIPDIPLGGWLLALFLCWLCSFCASTWLCHCFGHSVYGIVFVCFSHSLDEDPDWDLFIVCPLA